MGSSRMASDQKKARRLNATIAFADESGFLMAPLVRSTWAPRGKTPILRQRGRSHTKMSVIGAICTTATGKRSRLYFRIHQERNINAPLCADFLRQLRQNIRGNIILVWDRLSVHRSRTVAAVIAKDRRIWLEYLPPYAPELNPIESAWGYAKGSTANHAPVDADELFETTKNALCRTRRKKNLLHSFIDHSGLIF